MATVFRLLGDIEVRSEGRPVDVGHARQRCVLAVLLMSPNRVVPAGSVVERVWGDCPPKSARNTLYSYLVRLRQALAGCAEVELVRRSGGYLLSVAAGSVDVHRFRELVARAGTATGQARIALVEEALALWHDEPFAGLDTPWLNNERVALLAERFALELDHTDLLLAQGEHARLVTELSARAAACPEDERVAGQLMLALYRCGRTAAALDHYAALRSRLAETLGVDPGPQLRELHRRILTADVELSGVPVVPVPRQLPAPPRLFLGRARELAELDKAITTHHADSMVVVTLAGQGGVGKTWVALHWAHQNADRFPDGQLHLDLHGFDPIGEPTDPHTALRTLLDALGVPSRSVPASTEARAALFRSLVAGRRMLLVLDNAADTGHVVPLLPGSPACTVLVTSRRHLDGLVTAHGALVVQLDVLNETEARDLLVGHLGHRRVAAEPAATREVLDRCAGLPLALAVVAARAARHPGFPLAALADELRTGPDRLAAFATGDLSVSLREVCAASHRSLDSEPAELFTLLGLAPGPDLSLTAAASLAGLPTDQAGPLLHALENANLVRQHEPGRYVVHDLIRLYGMETARAELPADVLATARDRLLDHYLHTGYAGERLLEPLREPIRPAPPAEGSLVLTPHTEAAALAWFEEEHANLLAAQHMAAEHGRPAAVWQLAWTLSTFHIRRGHGHERIAVWETAVSAAGDDPAVHALVHRSLGLARADAGDTAAARTHLDLALAATSDPVTQANIHHALARVHDLDDDPETALAHLRHAIHVHRNAGNEPGTARAGAALGWLAAHRGHPEEAAALCLDALALGRALDSPEIEAAVLDTLGYLAHETGDHETALRHYTEALTRYAAAGETYATADTHDHLARTHQALGDRPRAGDHWRQALRLYRSQLRTEDADRIVACLASL